MKDYNGEDIYMDDVKPMILSADATDLEDILYYVRLRYAELFPNWEMGIISMDKSKDRILYLSSIIALLERLKQEE